MIVSRTPLRISFLGGGTDYPAWSKVHGGACLSATIDKYTYLTVRRLPPFFEHRNRIVYRVIETTRNVAAIQHPTVRTVLQQLALEDLEIHHDADLPARAGMGTSSAFTVGLLNSCHALQGSRAAKRTLAEEAIRIEQDLLRENVGVQDQIAAAFGGLNRMRFEPGGNTPFQVERLVLPEGRLEELLRHLLLFFTGVSRTASEVASTFVAGLDRNMALAGAVDAVTQGVEILSSKSPLEPFGELLDHAWQKKRTLSTAVSTPTIDEHYACARAASAIGGKLLGAGGGGFMLFFARPVDHERIRAALVERSLLPIPFRFEAEGSRIIVYEP